MPTYKIKAGTQTGFTVTQVLPFLLIAAAIFFGAPILKAFKGILATLGLADSEGDKITEGEIMNTSPWWTPTYWTTVNGGQKPMYYAQVDVLAQTIYNAFGAFNDNEEAAIGAFRKLKSKAECSFLVDYFQRGYGVDLLTWLQGGNYPQDRLSNEELAIIINIVNKLPKS